MTVTRTEEPNNRLTRLCDVMIKAFEEHAEHGDGDRVIVMIVGDKDDRSGQAGGVGLAGYDSESDDGRAMADLLTHLRVIFRANGKELHIVPVGTTPPGERA